LKVYRESYKLYKVSPLKFNPFPESRRRLNVPTVTVTLPTKDIIVDQMTLAGLEPPPALQPNISPLDTQSDTNIYHDFDPIIDRITWTRDRIPRIVVSGSNLLTSSADIIIERDCQELVRSAFLWKYPELLSADIPFANMLRWFNIQFQTNQFALEPRLYARVQKSALRPLGDEKYEYGQAHRGFVPGNNTSSVYRGRPVPVPR